MDSIDARRAEAQRLLRLYAVPEGSEARLWRKLDTPYFQRHTAEEIAWHARHLYWRVEKTEPVVKARLARDGAGMQVLVYLPDQKELFARLCGFFGRTGLSILEAKIHTTRAGYALDTFALNDPVHADASYRETLQMVEFELTRLLTEQPGLLARIAYTLAKANINVASAKINTLGERAEDVFLIDGARLHDEQALLRLETALYEQLRT